jgi:hypothetical protein
VCFSASNVAYAISCDDAAEVVNRVFTGKATTGNTNKIPRNYKPKCKLPDGLITAIRSVESKSAKPSNTFGCLNMANGVHDFSNSGGKYQTNISGKFNSRNEIQSTIRAAEYLCYLSDLPKYQNNLSAIVKAFSHGEDYIDPKSNANEAKLSQYCQAIEKASKINNPNKKSVLSCNKLQNNLKKTAEVLSETVGNLNAGLKSTIECFGCKLFQALTSFTVKYADLIFDMLSSELITLMSIFTSVFVLYLVMKLLLPFGPDGRAISTLTVIINMLALTLVAMLLLRGTSLYWEYVYIPVLDSTFTALEVIGSGELNCDNVAYSDDRDQFAKDMGAMMYCQMNAMVEGINNGARVGWAVVSASGQYKITWKLKGLKNFAKWLLLVSSGLVLFILYTYASMMLLFSALEVMVRWSYTSIMIPISIATIPYRSLRNIGKQSFSDIINGAVTLVILTTISGITTQLMETLTFDDDKKALNLKQYIEKIESSTEGDGFIIPTFNTVEWLSLFIIGLLTSSLFLRAKDFATIFFSGNLQFGVNEHVRSTVLSRAGGATNLAQSFAGNIGQRLKGG